MSRGDTHTQSSKNRIFDFCMVSVSSGNASRAIRLGVYDRARWSDERKKPRASERKSNKKILANDPSPFYVHQLISTFCFCRKSCGKQKTSGTNEKTTFLCCSRQMTHTQQGTGGINEKEVEEKVLFSKKVVMNTSETFRVWGPLSIFHAVVFVFFFSSMYFAFCVSPFFLSIWKDAQLKRSVVFPLGHDNYQSSQWETLYNGERKGSASGERKKEKKEVVKR